MAKISSLAGLRRKRQNTFLIGEEEKVTKREIKIVRERIINNSKSDDWEEARREWEFIGMILEDDYIGLERFSNSCQLCNQRPLTKNFEINNPLTGVTFLVGSTCIKRFIMLKGASSQSESAAIFEFQAKKMFASRTIQELLPSILTESTRNDVDRFRNASKVILGSLKNKEINNDAWEEYLRFVFGPVPPPPGSIDKIRYALFEPRKLQFKKVTDLSTGKEEARWTRDQKAKTRVRTTLVSKKDRKERFY